jgi:enolase
MSELAVAVNGLDCRDQALIDTTLEQTDGTPGFRRLGANAALPLSVAAAKIAALAEGLELYQWLALGGVAPTLPLPMVNVFSGGAHAAGAIDLQDYLVVPVSATSVSGAIEMAVAVREAAAGIVREKGGVWALVADEGGIAALGPYNHTALDLLTSAIERVGLVPGVDAGIAIDVAASQFAEEVDGTTRYCLATDGLTFDSESWASTLIEWLDRWPIVSLEDALGEDDWAGWALLTQAVGGRVQLLGDDLFVTNELRLATGISDGVANAVLVKPNQAGTLTQARRVVAQAHQAGYRTVLSARSGETEEDWMSDLAVGWNTGQIKVGSTTRSERTAKWNRLLEIEALQGATVPYAGGAAIRGREASA